MGVPKLFSTLINQYHHSITNPTGYNVILNNINNNNNDINNNIDNNIDNELNNSNIDRIHLIVDWIND
jgi:hypothetical protein